ncbi:MAG: PKD-like domain-containing protein [Bacteroidota bacterium]
MKKIFTLLVLSMSLWVSAQCPTASISYAGPYCNSNCGLEFPTLTGTNTYTGGTYSASPAGLFFWDTSTGSISPCNSTPGNYTVTYTLVSAGCPTISATTTLTIKVLPSANISYPNSGNFCQFDPPKSVDLTGTGAYMGGTFSNTSGLTINATTGTITPSTSVSGSHFVSYTLVSAGCPTYDYTANVFIADVITPTFSPISPICSGATAPVLPTSSDDSTSITGTWTPSTVSNTTSATYTFTPNPGQCANTVTMNVTVNNPVVTATPSIQSICSGDNASINLSSNMPGTTYSWTVVETNAGGAASGTGNIINQSLYSLTNDPGEIVYTITPRANGCTGNSINVTVTVNPSPSVYAVGDVLCSGNTTNVVLTSDVTGTTYSWTAIQNGVTGATSGTGNIINQILTTTGSSQGQVTYYITPQINGCYGYMISVDVTVKPSPEIFGAPTQTILSGEPFNTTFSSSLSGTTFSWTVVQTGITGAIAGSGSSINQVLTTTGITPGTGVYTVTPNRNGCNGPSIDVTVNVLYVPGLVSGTIGTDGVGNVTQPYLLDTLLNDGRYTCEWTLDGVAFRGTNGVNGITTNQYSATQAGRYCVVAVNNTTGFRSLEACADVTTQVLSNSEFNSLKLTYSPNPVTDVLTIQSKELLKKVTVYNTLGQKVYSNVLNDLNPKIDLSSLVSGNYFVKVEAENKQNVFQIVKK